ncbi:MAG TPA: ABC transporter ATP-binding protein [Chloroflexota bacterium]|nr:ABC transporter ATP-binding protein [Chloroflexota bacterium]
MAALIELQDVSKVYGTEVRTTALAGATLGIGRGELVVILGPSGSGKSTLLNLIGGLDRPTSGHVRVNGVDLGALSPAHLADFRRDTIGFVFQFYNLIPSLTARENVQFAADLSHCPERVDTVLAAVGLAGRAHRFPAQLSGGEQQRVAIARALVKDPPVLLCDEPTGALDGETGQTILGLLQARARRDHQTVLIVTHDQDLAALATRLIRLRDGTIRADEIIQSAHSGVAALAQ